MTLPARTTPCVCGVCASRAQGYGYAPPTRNSRILWVCDDPDCLSLARATYHMSQNRYDKCEANAISAAGAAAGQYLDELSKTDMAALSEKEWDNFCLRMIAVYRAQLAWEVAQAHAELTGSDKIPY
jgi:hypothetical protein